MNDDEKRMAELIRANTSKNHKLLAFSKIADDGKTGAEYLLVLRTKKYRGIDYIDLRYFVISQQRINWMKNGLTCRDVPETRTALKKLIERL